ncbi:MAG TPA: zf-HC2 domain-containing protein [Ktedonobacterales bacterium]|jgi:hypothetical protein|nr:zf-HC2 domain-containing protein [Ktedonobacterales bacterium]
MSDNETLDCDTIAPYLSAYADGELAEPVRAQVATHLADCAHCASQLDRIRTIDQIVSSLPRTAPSAGVFERVLTAANHIVSTDPRTVTRETLPGANGAALLRRIRELIAPDDIMDDIIDNIVDDRRVSGDDEDGGVDEGMPGTARLRPRRARPPWIAAAIPAAAALLIVALAATLFNRFPSFPRQGAITHPTPNVESPLRQTRSAVAALAGQLAFTPISPTYLPSGASAPRATTGPAEQTQANSRYLDVMWTFSGGPVTTLRLREMPHGLGFDGYTAGSSNAAAPLTWSLPNATGWQPLTSTTCARCLAVGETRPTLQIALDAQPRAAASADAVAAWLRLVSLSLDAPYQPIHVSLAAPDSSLALRYLATVTDAQGHVWTWDVSTFGASGIQQSARARGVGSDVTEIVNGGSVARLDNATHTYESLAPPAPSAQPPRIVTQPLNAAEEYVAAGEFWNLGVKSVTLPDGRTLNAYDLFWVNAAQPEHLYADASSGQMIALVVTPSDSHPGGPNGVRTFISTTACQPYIVTYTFVEYVPQTTQMASLFSTQEPPGWRQGAVAPAFTCGG